MKVILLTTPVSCQLFFFERLRRNFKTPTKILTTLRLLYRHVTKIIDGLKFSLNPDECHCWIHVYDVLYIVRSLSFVLNIALRSFFLRISPLRYYVFCKFETTPLSCVLNHLLWDSPSGFCFVLSKNRKIRIDFSNMIKKSLLFKPGFLSPSGFI